MTQKERYEYYIIKSSESIKVSDYGFSKFGFIWGGKSSNRNYFHFFNVYHKNQISKNVLFKLYFVGFF